MKLVSDVQPVLEIGAGDPRRTPLGRRFLVVWAGQTVSEIGTMMSGIGVAVYVFVETGDAVWLGLLSAAASVPYVAATPFLKLADRIPRRTMMIAADSFAAVAPAVALTLALAGRLEVWHLVLAGFIGGLGNAFQVPAAQAAVPALVNRDALDRANGLMQLGPAAGLVLGPALATPLVAWIGIEAVLVVDLVTFVAAVIATIATRFDPVPTDDSVVDDGSWRAIRDFLADRGRPLLGLIVAAGLVNFVLAFFNVSLLVLSTDLGGTARAGIPIGVAGLVMVIASAVVGARGVGSDRVRAFVRAMLLMGAGCLVAASRPSFPVLIVGVVIAVLGIPALNASIATLYLERTPSSMHARMFALTGSIGRALDPLGAVLAGVIVARVAGPLMSEGGALSGTLGSVIGIGPDRGAALVLVAVGVALAASTGLIKRGLRGLSSEAG